MFFKSKKDKEKKNNDKQEINKENNNEDEIEVVFGDESVLNLSEVNDCMNPLRPKDSVSNRKNVIIPGQKKPVQNNEENKTNQESDVKSEDNDNDTDHNDEDNNDDNN